MQPYRQQEAYDTLVSLDEDMQLACAFINKNVRVGLSHVAVGLIKDVIMAQAELLKWEYGEHGDVRLQVLEEYLDDYLTEGKEDFIEAGLMESFADVRDRLNRGHIYG